LHPVFRQLTHLICDNVYDPEEEFWDNLAQLKDLEHLDLCRSGLKSLSNKVYSLSKLKTLNLIKNQLQELPEGIGELQQLECLLLNYNRISKLPADIADTTKLQILDMTSNALTSLPPSLAKLNNLQMLNLKWNGFTELPEFLLHMKSINTLIVPNNDFKERFAIGKENRAHYDTWKKYRTNDGFIADFESKHQASSIHSIHFDLGSTSHIKFVQYVQKNHPQIPVTYDWRRESYY
jgi:Leucine-rich repeat (LRR) protein